jgi:hypothetical protein
VITKGTIWKFIAGKESSNLLNFCASYESSEETKKFYKLERDFQGRDIEFWLETTGRFFHLRDAMKSLGIESYFHMESDVVLLQKDAIAKVLGNEKNDFLAFPMQSSKVGCASLLISKGHEPIDSLIAMILSKWQNFGYSDMELLGDFATNSETMKYYVSLPTLISAFEYSTGYLWDPGAIGPYFLGGDARNKRIPLSLRGMAPQEWMEAIENVSWGSKRFSKGKLIAIQIICNHTNNKFRELSLANIHIHSKRVPDTPMKLNKMLSRGFFHTRDFRWRFAGVDWTVFMERVFDFTRRRVFRKARKVINLR